DLGQDRLDQIVVMNLGVKAIRWKTADAASYQSQAGFVIDGRLVLSQDDQRRPGLVQPRIHAARDFYAARQRQANVDAVGHIVGRERAADLFLDFVVRRNLRECQSQSRAAEPSEVLVQPENSAVI